MSETAVLPNVALTESQKNSINKAVYWFKKETHKKQVFTIAGYAGTGKTTIVRVLIEELGIGKDHITFAAFTGKAALQLRRNGNEAETIHRLIYDVNTVNGQVEFVKKPAGSLPYQLIVIDEVSMVSQDILQDLLSFGIPVIALGDHGQLDPIGKDNGLLKKPDVILTEIHRQAKDNPIIHLSMLAREGRTLPLGKMGNEVYVLRKGQSRINPETLLRANQVLCSTNNKRRELNMKMRRIKGFTSKLPEKNDKIICTKNNWEENVNGISLINGLIGTVNRLKKIEDSNIIELDFLPEFSTNQLFRKLRTLEDTFLEKEVSLKQKQEFDMFDYGYAITTHKAQGSQWPNVVAYFQPMRGDQDSQKKLLYTAITRAQEKLILELP
ncbi:ATP-dependent DNA helicase [Bacillus piscicola]|uniref:ATP-dependent DNA helicase n=1 Tax=Bacillus piscicola TaxID=1632684 RepID=UPI001F09C1DE|nr:AAA family ATPase [Bacillus piscicola]